ncbi:unnamed protein product [Withania somnifera]
MSGPYYFFPTDFYYPRPSKINGDKKKKNKSIPADDVAVRGGVLENPVNGRDLSLQDKILKVSTPLSMNLVRYQAVLASKNEGTWKWTTNY